MSDLEDPRPPTDPRGESDAEDAAATPADAAASSPAGPAAPQRGDGTTYLRSAATAKPVLTGADLSGIDFDLGPERPGRSLWRLLREILIVLVLALILSIFVRHFVVQVYSIPSESMENTLMTGDRILVNRIPVVGKQVERGDVVVFNDTLGWMSPRQDNEDGVLSDIGVFLGLIPADGNRVMVKRVVAVGGDTVGVTESGQLEVNGITIDEPYVANGALPSRMKEEVVVPEGYYWVLGDNRDHSADSSYHYAFGDDAFISADDVIGKVQWVIYPVSHWSSVSHREAFADVRNAG